MQEDKKHSQEMHWTLPTLWIINKYYNLWSEDPKDLGNMHRWRLYSTQNQLDHSRKWDK